jgi:hypothetical protein
MRSGISERSVFINCPFDEAYRPIFEALVFAIFECGFVPRSALELIDGGEVRLEKICRIIAECRYSVHDISRTELDTAHKLPRFNMPFELGLFIGAIRFGSKANRSKFCLILDREAYRYQSFLSDIAGQDIQAHGNDPDRAIRCVRDWLSTMPGGPSTMPGSAYVSQRYSKFRSDLPQLMKDLKLTSVDVTFPDLCNLVARWLQLLE